MNARFELTPQAIDDLDAVWWTIAEDNRDAAERVETEILATCQRLAKHPRISEKRYLTLVTNMLPSRMIAVREYQTAGARLACGLITSTRKLPLKCPSP
jgi:plasmid stabilization system protein ParE